VHARQRKREAAGMAASADIKLMQVAGAMGLHSLVTSTIFGSMCN